ncbi:MAG: hypothetical protein BWZ03_00212 [bacterium ADurb.BinA186]|nr:MAG: hypothetical protein BWZ03_00212 [bacterium ADurb.BinA186]
MLFFLGCNKEASHQVARDRRTSPLDIKEVVLPEPKKEVFKKQPIAPEIIEEVSPVIVAPFPLGPRLSGGGGGGPADKCGSGVLSEGEECGDGNKISFDGCSATCQLEKLLSIEQDDDQLHAINPLTGASLCERTVSLAGFTIRGANGLATDPLTRVLWGLLRESGSPDLGGNSPKNHDFGSLCALKRLWVWFYSRSRTHNCCYVNLSSIR